MKAIAPASEDEINRLTRSWFYGYTSETGTDDLPFLFINEGAETLSGSEHGAAIIRDAVTCREIERLQHTGICGSSLSLMSVDIHASSPRPSRPCDGIHRFYPRMWSHVGGERTF